MFLWEVSGKSRSSVPCSVKSQQSTEMDLVFNGSIAGDKSLFSEYFL